MSCKAIVFDAFGTLFDIGSGGSAKKIISNIHSCGKNVDEESFIEEWKAFYIANTSDKCEFHTEREIFLSRIKMFYDRYDIERNAETDSEKIIQEAYERKAFPETGEVLEKLREKYVVFIASNTDNDVLNHVMDKNNVYADKVYTSENLRCYKPDPDFFRQILDDSGLKPYEILFVGDSVRDDIIGPKEFGIKTVFVCRNGVYENSGQDYTISNLNELLEICENETIVNS